MMTRKSLVLMRIGITFLAITACVARSNTPGFTQTPTFGTAIVTENTRVVTPTPGLIIVSPISPTVLPEEEAHILLVNLLQTNAGCKLPCWWGITPGVSMSSEAYSTLIAFQEIAYVGLLYPESGVAYFKHFDRDMVISLNVGFLSNAGGDTVRTMKIFTQALRDLGNSNYIEVYDSPKYRELLAQYSINNLLSEYGAPPQVVVRADVYDDTQQDTFEVTLLYPELGIFARYNAPAETVGDNIQGCPSDAFVELWLLSPSEKDSYQSILSMTDETWEGNFPYSKSIEDVSSMSINDFFVTFREPTNQCLVTPKDVWPSH